MLFIFMFINLGQWISKGSFIKIINIIILILIIIINLFIGDLREPLNCIWWAIAWLLRLYILQNILCLRGLTFYVFALFQLYFLLIIILLYLLVNYGQKFPFLLIIDIYIYFDYYIQFYLLFSKQNLSTISSELSFS